MSAFWSLASSVLHRGRDELNSSMGDRRPALRPKVQRESPHCASQAEAVTRDPRNDQKGSASVQAEAMSVPNGFMGFMKSAA